MEIEKKVFGTQDQCRSPEYQLICITSNSILSHVPRLQDVVRADFFVSFSLNRGKLLDLLQMF